MNRPGTFRALIVGVVVTALGGAAFAQQPAPPTDPQGIAKLTVTLMTSTANAAVKQNTERSHQAVVRIKALLAEGKPDAAKAVASNAIKIINTQSDRAAELIKAQCARGIKAIKEAGGSEELITFVKTACQRQIERVRRSQMVAVKAIRDALAEAPAEPVE